MHVLDNERAHHITLQERITLGLKEKSSLCSSRASVWLMPCMSLVVTTPTPSIFTSSKPFCLYGPWAPVFFLDANCLRTPTANPNHVVSLGPSQQSTASCTHHRGPILVAPGVNVLAELKLSNPPASPSHLRRHVKARIRPLTAPPWLK